MGRKEHGTSDRQRVLQICLPLATCKTVFKCCHTREATLSRTRTDAVSRVAVSPLDFPHRPDGSDTYLLINGSYVFTARPFDGFPPGQISLSDPQRTWASVSLMDTVNAQIYDPFSEGGHNYLGSMDVEVGFAGRKSTEAPYDQDELADHFTRVRR